MSLGAILLVILIMSFVGIIPIWQHSRSWGVGYALTGGVGPAMMILEKTT